MESKLLGVDDMMPMILWARYFLATQGLQGERQHRISGQQKCTTVREEP